MRGVEVIRFLSGRPLRWVEREGESRTLYHQFLTWLV